MDRTAVRALHVQAIPQALVVLNVFAKLGFIDQVAIYAPLALLASTLVWV
jgi:hypothetical protein